MADRPAPRYLIDTNIIVSAIVFGGLPRTLLAAALSGQVDLVASPDILDEVDRVLRDKFRVKAPELHSLLAELGRIAEIVDAPATSTSAPVRDPRDVHVLAAAVAGAVDAIVTGDRDLLELPPVEIISAREAATQLGLADQ